MIQKKICMLGAFAVGKTSLVRRFVSDVYDERYLTTVGVRIEKKDVQVDGQSVRLLLWDLNGEDRFQFVQASHLRGAAGYLVVIDGTRPATLDVAYDLRTRALDTLGSIPFVTLLNKSDLEQQLSRDEVERRMGSPVQSTSAKVGSGVIDVFSELTRRIV